jgi:hypothetical protein
MDRTQLAPLVNLELPAMDGALPNIPWQDAPAGNVAPLWRYSKNPVIGRSPFPTSNSVFNSAVVPFRGKFAGVFRCDDTARVMQIHTGFSDDGIHWRIDPERIRWQNTNPEITRFEYSYDPRVCWIDDRFYVTWCNGYHGPTIGMGWTRDFVNYHQMDNALLPYNRNGVLFPRQINGKYMMLSRPSDNGHTPFGDIFISQSPDMIYWGEHRHVMKPNGGWQSTICLQLWRRPAGSGTAVEGAVSHLAVFAEPARELRMRRRRSKRCISLRCTGGSADKSSGDLLRLRGHGDGAGVWPAR